ncbi:MAG: hypothetical protein MN733_06995, partial [Nitrososphaera sp.]|nr:hypothetical protein [Nitrososphaera sp.]
LAHIGPTLGKRNSEWFSVGGSPSSIAFNDGAGDSDQTASGTFTVDHGNEDYLVFFRYRLNSISTTGVRALRVTCKIDGEDIVNVRTDTATLGATRTGRGFQYRDSADAGLRVRTGPFRVMNLSAGTHTPEWTFNRHESADQGETVDGIAMLGIRTQMLSQFTYDEYDEAIAVTSDTPATAPWSVTITADGTTPIILGFCTSTHVGDDGVVDLTMFRDDTLITEDAAGAGAAYAGFSQANYDNIADGSAGTGDSDNGTYPLTIWWTDTPSAGSHTYTIKYARNSSASAGASGNSILNCNDNGGSGFVGTLFAFEMKFATVF